MNSSQLIEIRRQREISAANFLATSGPTRQLGTRSSATGGDIMSGAIQVFSKGQVVDANILPGTIINNTIPNQYILTSQQIALQLFEDLLNYIKTTGKGPTITARLIYIWTFTAASAWQSIQPEGTDKLITGIHDQYDWDWRASYSGNASDWLCQTLAPAMSSFLPGYSSSLRQSPNSSWYSLWQTWFIARQADGSNTLPSPTISDLSNINLQIDPTISGLPDTINMNQWTPLYVNNKKQAYVTFAWGTVRSTCLTNMDELSIYTQADSAYPNEVQRQTEVTNVKNMTQTLTDSQKMSAEFWAGGPGTATPPGALSWFWAEYCRQGGLPDRVFFLSGLDLGIHLFEGSRVTWKLKSKHVQSRPIQEIRNRFANTIVTMWNGVRSFGANWTPYQESNFVTPAFADFPSGHSHFSATFAEVMKKWFGNTVSYTPTRRLDFLSPILQNGSSLVASTGSSIIQPGIVPSSEKTFTWSTWDDLATDAGMSRLYGGIHCISAHIGSQNAAREAHMLIENAWGFSV